MNSSSRIIDPPDMTLAVNGMSHSAGKRNFILVPLKMEVDLLINEPPHGKTNNLHMRKQRRRSASR